MTTRLFLSLIFILCNQGQPAARQCVYTKLSKIYTFKVSCVEIGRDGAEDMFPTRKINLYIYKKDKTLVQQISFTAESLFEDVFKSDSASRSYITGHNKTAAAPDYDYGDLIVADMNFDGKEDIIIKRDSGGNGGPFYDFYLQNEKGKFTLDRYLTDRIESFPAHINKQQKTIETQIHANVHQEAATVFKYNILTKKWRVVKRYLISY